MSQNFLGEIRMFAGTFAPMSWAFCQGQLLSIAQYDALYSLIGSTYGGDGQTNFALPNLQSRVPIGQGQGPGLTSRVLGQMAGEEEVTITTTTMPAHSHAVLVSTAAADNAKASGLVPAMTAGNDTFYTIPATGKTAPTLTPMSPKAVQPVGNGLPHDNLMPLLCLNFILALQGIYPSRN
jgi:microcystin-dependent protein